MVMQIRRTLTPDHAPDDLVEGQLAIEMGSDLPRLWTGVPPSIDPSRRRLISAGVNTSISLAGSQLVFESENECIFRGNAVMIDGELLTVPGGQISVPNANVMVQGTPGQNLAVSTTYNVFLHRTGANNDIITPAFFSEASGHAMSQAPGNAGTEILLGDDRYSLIGKVRTDVSAQFSDNHTNRFVLSWFTPRRTAIRFQFTTNGAGTYPNYIPNQARYLAWGYRGESCTVHGGTTSAHHTAAGMNYIFYVAPMFDNGAGWNTTLAPPGNVAASAWSSYTFTPVAEGLHTIGIAWGTLGASFSFNAVGTAEVWC